MEGTDCPTSVVWDSLAAVFPATAAAAEPVFVPIAESVAGAAALAAPFSLHQPDVARPAGAPAPASAGVSVGPVPASRITFPAVAGTSGPASVFLCSEEQGVLEVEGR